MHPPGRDGLLVAQKKRRLPKSILETLAALGLEPRPVDARSRSWLVAQRGLARLTGRDPRALTLAQKRELARLYREERDSAERRGATKEYSRNHPEWVFLSDFNKQQLKNARRAVDSERTPFLRRLARLPRTAGTVVFIPDNPAGPRRHFYDYAEFEKFASLPHYRKDFEELEGQGRFVVGDINPDTRTLYQHKNGKPKYSTVLAKGTIDGEQREQSRRTGKNKGAIPRRPRKGQASKANPSRRSNHARRKRACSKKR